MNTFKYSVIVAETLNEVEQFLEGLGQEGWRLVNNTITRNDRYALILEKEKNTHKNRVRHSRHYTTWNNKKRIG